MSAPGTTPGPWRFILNDEEVVAGAYGENVIVDAPLGDTPEQAIANANLIAAAPDGYEAGEDAIEALNAMMRTWFDYHDDHSLTDPVTAAAGNAFDKALAAREKLEAFVARARGEAQ